MTTFQIECTDKDTGQNYTALVDASREDIAKIKAVNEGHQVNSFDPVAAARKINGAGNGKATEDGGLMLASFLIPIVGILVGIIRLGTKNGGGELLAIGIGGCVFWLMLAALVIAR